jgi:peptide/nickel transport system substrate-binding protein
MRRRDLLKTAAATSMALALPNIGRAASASTLTFIPQADLAVLDPVWTSAYVTRNHGFLVFDTLYGIDSNYRAQPQMVAGHVVEADGLKWTLTLRDGLKFHDDTPVLARDCVASIKRWGARDAFGQALLAASDEIAAPDDTHIVFRLKHRFPLLPDALAKVASNMLPIMPERLAKTDPFTQVSEMVGSGPFRFRADERVPGARVVYERFAGYVPRDGGEVSWTAGPKRAHFDRVEWTVIPDAATASGAMQSGEADWLEQPSYDLLPLIRRNAKLRVDLLDPTGFPSMLRFNHLYPPFDNPAIRRALLGAVDQTDVMTAIAGDDKSMWLADIGIFPPASPMASRAGMAVLDSPRDYDKVKRELAAAGYKGEPVVAMLATDFPTLQAMGNVGIDILKRAGMNVDVQAMDWGTVVQRRAKREAPSKGGWNVFFTSFSGLDQFTPAGYLGIRGNGAQAWFGWPTAPKLEALRDQWFAAPDLASQQALCAQIQQQAFIDVPFLPLGAYYQPTVYRSTLSGVLKGLPLFWNVQRQG